ncbi:hypothetical protein GCM10029963_72850 [Micromonospora andamanensis]|uniref:PASTA domain-containing protein n=1 Tax=Micromonospora andamanensis TaxID=1287068 RepID=UPI001950A2A3|nr:PASTA domain-containing protein [Micromonospora andamanensis]GIJ39723.1 hypothetical protein Vwe01_30480 [Micromonospora andamanensis]
MNATIAGLALAVLGILVGIVIALLQRRPKRVVYDMITRSQIVSHTGYRATGKLQVLYEGRQLADPHLLVLRVANGGKIEIRPEDWIERLKIVVSRGVEIVDAAIAGSAPSNLEVKVEQTEKSQVTISSVLLNRQEWFDVQLLIDGPGEVQEISARVAGAQLLPGRPIKGMRGLISTLPRLTSRLHLGEMGSWAFVSTAVATVGFVVAFSSFFLLDRPEMATVPDLTGKSAEVVVPELRRAGLHLGAQDRLPNSAPKGTVIDQHPPGGSKIEKGERVSIVLSE